MFQFGSWRDTDLCWVGHFELMAFREPRKTIQKNLDKMKAAHGAVDVSDVEIRTAVGNFKDEVMYADPKKRKRAVAALFKEIWIHPQKGSPWKRILEIKGVCVPLTRLSAASPREHAAYHSCSKNMILTCKNLIL